MVSFTAGSGLTGRRQLIRDNYFAGLLLHSKMVDPVQKVFRRSGCPKMECIRAERICVI